MRGKILWVVALLCLLMAPTATVAASTITVNLDGEAISFDEKPVIREAMVFVPLRTISENLGAQVQWNETTRSITLIKGDVTNALTLDRTEAVKRVDSTGTSKTITLASPPVLLNGTTFVPLRYIAEGFGALVDWEERSNGGLVTITSPKKLTVGSKTVTLGESLQEVRNRLGPADRIDESIYPFQWHVYNKDYASFLMVGIDDSGTIRGFYTNSKLFRYNDELAYGDLHVTTVKGGGTLFTDKYEQNKVHAILVTVGRLDSNKFVDKPEVHRANELENWDATNAFRFNYGLRPLGYDETAAITARGHSQDMADQNYFEHTGLDGRSPWDRYKDNKGPYFGSGENISAGRISGIESFNGWLNSEGHRNNMLSENHTRFGVGTGYNPKSKYRYYYTQFFSSGD
ncbi:Uncharacterized conserved protein YkwD, contains CAP (CSP/antigen 5/PR1) domain [Paenibacillus sp. 1_12]|uniref:stalk domain-containing protein n=1 Tax=Paenibacillus sp. 1_12 TaxID=1566278 RepID=UPI0008EC0D4A|nr:stalk domain-containing protein [Paenibacillus sp. 1_12]SFM43340.1 Uncharacterized conserved protein YkwD, contains CAP (CSP/antigen 5/PR1) domain [Paenibacillus sp. 1_12]